MVATLAKVQAIGDETRFRILRVLALAPAPLCVAEIVDVVRKPQYAVSRAIRSLAKAELVTEERDGKLRLYAVNDHPNNKTILALVSSTQDEHEPWLHDRDRLRWRIQLRRNGTCVVMYPNGYTPQDATKTGGKRKVLVICVHNSARSQIAAAYLKQLGADLFAVESAGLTPGTLNRYVVQVLAEDGVDISRNVPQSVFDLYRSGNTYSYVITVCSREAEQNCPLFPGPVRRLSWPFPDPAQFQGSEAEILNQTREIRNVIKEAVHQFVSRYRKTHAKEVLS